MSKHREQEIPKSARLLQMKISHHAFRKMRLDVFFRLPGSIASVGPDFLALGTTGRFQHQTFKLLVHLDPFLASRWLYTAQAGVAAQYATGLRVGLEFGGTSVSGRRGRLPENLKSNNSVRRAVYARFGTLWFPVELISAISGRPGPRRGLTCKYIVLRYKCPVALHGYRSISPGSTDFSLCFFLYCLV